VTQRYLSISLFLCAIAHAQNSGTAVLRGQIESDGASTEQEHVVNVTECGGGGIVAHVVLGFSNWFEFSGLKPGCKVIEILSADERQVEHEEHVYVDGDRTPVVIRLTQKRGDKAPAGSGVVSADRLRHPLPKKTMQALAEASKLSESGRFQEAAAKLQKLIEQSPDVWEARLNLGAVEMKLGHANEALANFSQAREMEPHSSMAALDSAIALLVLRRFPEAEAAGRQALRLDPSNKTAQQLLDRIQMGRERGFIKSGPE
jgi:Flp pilus assembly protein TadD